MVYTTVRKVYMIIAFLSANVKALELLSSCSGYRRMLVSRKEDCFITGTQKPYEGHNDGSRNEILFRGRTTALRAVAVTDQRKMALDLQVRHGSIAGEIGRKQRTSRIAKQTDARVVREVGHREAAAPKRAYGVDSALWKRLSVVLPLVSLLLAEPMTTTAKNLCEASANKQTTELLLLFGKRGVAGGSSRDC